MRTVTVEPGVLGVANAHAPKVTRDGDRRTGRPGSPPASRMSNDRVSFRVLPAATFVPKSSLRLVYVSVTRWTATVGVPEPPLSTNPDVPGWTVRYAVRK